MRNNQHNTKLHDCQIIDLTWASTDKASNEINISNIKMFNYSETS